MNQWRELSQAEVQMAMLAARKSGGCRAHLVPTQSVPYRASKSSLIWRMERN